MAIKYQQQKLQGDNFIKLIQSMHAQNLTYNSIQMNFIDSGSRKNRYICYRNNI